MTKVQKAAYEKRMKNKMFTEVRSIDGKTLADVAPDLENRFENYSEAFREIMKATGKRPNLVLTRRVNATSYAARS